MSNEVKACDVNGIVNPRGQELTAMWEELCMEKEKKIAKN